MFFGVGRIGSNGKKASAVVPPAIPQTNLLLWLKADAGTLKSDSSPAANGDLVNKWVDQGPNGTILTSSSTASGTCPTLATNQVNGNPALRFIQNDNFQFPVNQTLTNFDLYIVLSKTNSGTDNIVTGRSTQFNYLVLAANGNVQMLQVSGSSAVRAHAGFANNTFYMIGGRNNGTNLTARAGNALTTSVVASGTTEFDNIGWYLNGAAAPTLNYDGYMAEYILYSAFLGASDRTQVETYLQTKYGVA